MRDRLARWMKGNEATLIPLWIRAVRERGGEHDLTLSTVELKRTLFLELYSRFVQALETHIYSQLDALLERMTHERVEKAYTLEEILLVPTQLKEVTKEKLSTTMEPAEALKLLRVADTTFDHCVITIARAFSQKTEMIVNQRLAEVEFLTSRLAIATEESDHYFIQLRNLYDLSRGLSSTLDVQHVLRLIAETLVALPGIARCAVWMKMRENVLSAVMVCGEDNAELEGVRLALATPDSVITQAFAAQQMTKGAGAMENGVSQGVEALASPLAGRAVMAVPLLSDEEPIGVISVDGPVGARPFTPSLVNLVQSIAEQAAIALRNARLYVEIKNLNQELEQRVQERTRELEQANRDLERLDKTKSDFINIAAHELKTPLTLIQGYANILTRDESLLGGNEAALRIVEGILRGSQRLKDVISDMIDVSMIDSDVLALQLEPVSLNTTVELAIRGVREAARQRGQTIVVEGVADLPYIDADPQRLHQVFANLISNAIKYTPDGGRITIRGRRMNQQGPDGDFVELVVADTGIGIDPEDQERIFRKFYRIGEISLHSTSKTRFKGAGPGLGLAIARGIIEAHGGTIWVESEGHDEKRCPGSEFHVLLPIKAKSTTRRTRFIDLNRLTRT